MPEDDNFLDFHPLERGVQAERALGPTQNEKSTRPQDLSNVLQDSPFGGQVEVDQHVPEEDDVALRDADRRLRQVAAFEPGEGADLRLQRPVPAGLLEVPDQVLGRQPPVDLQLAVAGLAGRSTMVWEMSVPMILTFVPGLVGAQSHTTMASEYAS